MPRTPWLGIIVLVLTALAGLGPQYAMAFIGWLVLPAAFLAMVGLVDFSLERGDLQSAWEYLFARNFQQLDGGTVMAGCLSALYTLGAGVGMGLCFGARTPRQLPLLRSVCAAALIDTVFAVLVAVVVVPLLFATNTAVIEGMALVYVATPYAFANLSQGEAYGSVYFMTLAIVSFAALVALVEPAVMVLRRDFMWSRALAAAAVGGTIWCSTWARNHWLDFDVFVSYRSLDLAIVLSMLAMCLFVAWAVPRPLVRGELYREPKWLFLIWWYLLRYWVPVFALVVGVYLAVPSAFSVLGWVSIEP
jgi:NSS family neurotransmitter:Na+ symporter